MLCIRIKYTKNSICMTRFYANLFVHFMNLVHTKRETPPLGRYVSLL
jgi:hypothetical protein